MLRPSRSVLALLWCLLSVVSAQAQVRRWDVIATADQYVRFQWKPGAANVFHGKDAEGVLVETPDRSFTYPGIRPGWWVPDQTNEGMPYMWGGFSTCSEFKA